MGLGAQLRPRGGRYKCSGDSRVCPKPWVLQQVPCSVQGMGKLEGCEGRRNPKQRGLRLAAEGQVKGGLGKERETTAVAPGTLTAEKPRARK